MKTADFLEYISCESSDADLKVGSRERRDLEFKEGADENTIRKSVKTISAFANLSGGSVVFGVAERPRRICGVSSFWDEAQLQDLITKHLYPVPDVSIHEHDIAANKVFKILVQPAEKAPVVAIKDLQTKAEKNSTVLSQGTIYFRRAGRTKPISGEELSAILDKRDQRVRDSILGLLARAEKIGFESVALADFRQYGSSNENVTLFVPQGAARELNIIDRAKLVEDGGADAYQIRGSVKLTTSSERDPRKPLLPAKAARVLRQPIREYFGDWFPWSPSHLRGAAKHLGFWDNPSGDGTHTGINEVSGSPIYYEAGRAAVQRFANRSPDAFVEVVGSKDTKQRYQALQLDE